MWVGAFASEVLLIIFVVVSRAGNDWGEVGSFAADHDQPARQNGYFEDAFPGRSANAPWHFGNTKPGPA